MGGFGEFRRIYPSTGRIFLDGGLNSKFERSIIQDNESPDCQNVNFENGSVGTRQGTSKASTTPIGSFAGDGLYTRHDNDGSETMVAFCGGHMQTFDGISFITVASSDSIWTAGVRVAATEYQNYLFANNGGTTPYKYDGSVFSRHGVPAPSGTADIISNPTAAGTLTGDYRYAFTYLNTALAEGDISPIAGTLNVAAAKIDLSSIPVAPQSHGINARKIYRTEAGGSTYKLVTTINDNSTTTYQDNSDDTELGATAPSDNGEPPNYSICIYHQNRLFMNDPSNPNLLWYTELGEPFTVKTTNFIKIGDKSGKILKSLAVYDNSVVAGCQTDENWLIYMPDTTPSNWVSVKINGSYGNQSPFCNLEYENRLLFAAIESNQFVGFAALAGASVEPSATLTTISSIGSDLKSYRISSDMAFVQSAYVDRITGITFKNRAFISVTYGSGETKNNRIYMMDFSRSNLTKKNQQSWVPWTGGNICPEQFAVYDNKLYYISSKADGFVYQLEDGSYNDLGNAIDSYFWTKEFYGNKSDINFYKDFRYINMLIDKPGAYYMNLVFRVDSDAGLGTAKVLDLDPGGNQWGALTWGTDSWGGGNEQEDITVSLGQMSGKRIQLKFTNQNTVDQRFKVHSLNITYNIKGLR